MTEGYWSDLKTLKDICQDTYCPIYHFPWPECREGWKGLLVELVTDIDKLGIPWSIGQIKEKFGTLRFYADVFMPEDTWVQDVSKPNRTMTTFDETVIKFINKTNAEQRALYERFAELIAEAERKSAYICEVCAEPGKLRHTSWIQTLCDNCYDRYRDGRESGAR